MDSFTSKTAGFSLPLLTWISREGKEEEGDKSKRNVTRGTNRF